MLATLLALSLALPATWLTPRDGATLPASSWPQATPFEMTEFTIYLGDYDDAPYDFDVEVATSPATDADGTLADAGVIDRYEAVPRADYPGIYAARTRLDAHWLGTPGTYYWQAHSDDDTFPVRTLTITPAPAPDPSPPVVAPAPYVAAPPAAPPMPPLPASTARIVARRAIAAATHRIPRGLVYRCATAPGSAVCRPTWRDTRFRYRGTLAIAANASGVTARFSGERSSARRRAHTTNWSVTL